MKGIFDGISKNAVKIPRKISNTSTESFVQRGGFYKRWGLEFAIVFEEGPWFLMIRAEVHEPQEQTKPLAPCHVLLCSVLLTPPLTPLGFAPSQWETTLQRNVVSHWLGAYTKWSPLRHWHSGPIASEVTLNVWMNNAYTHQELWYHQNKTQRNKNCICILRNILVTSPAGTGAIMRSSQCPGAPFTNMVWL